MTNKRQARAIDIDNNARTGGTNFDLAVRHIRNGVYDFLIIKAGLGVEKSEVFDEQRQLTEKAGIPYLTYHIPDPHSPNKDNPKQNMKDQAKLYADWVGKNQPKYITDIEVPGSHSRLPKRKEINSYLSEIIKVTGKRPILYTRMNIIKSIGIEDVAAHYDLWIADYADVKSDVLKERGQYRFIEEFLNDYEWTLPVTVKNSKLEKNVVLWQFSDAGLGPHYIYNEKTKHPIYQDGKKSADLSVSIKGRDEVLKKLFGNIPDLPKAVPLHDLLTAEQIEELAQIGITPNVRVDLNLTDLQSEEFTTLQEMMDKSGITPKIKVNIQANTTNNQ